MNDAHRHVIADLINTESELLSEAQHDALIAEETLRTANDRVREHKDAIAALNAALTALGPTH